MIDTTEHIKRLQFRNLAFQTPSERLIQFLTDDEAFFKLVNDMKTALETENNQHRNLSSF